MELFACVDGLFVCRVGRGPERPVGRFGDGSGSDRRTFWRRFGFGPSDVLATVGFGRSNVPSDVLATVGFGRDSGPDGRFFGAGRRCLARRFGGLLLLGARFELGPALRVLPLLRLRAALRVRATLRLGGLGLGRGLGLRFLLGLLEVDGVARVVLGHRYLRAVAFVR